MVRLYICLGVSVFVLRKWLCYAGKLDIDRDMMIPMNLSYIGYALLYMLRIGFFFGSHS